MKYLPLILLVFVSNVLLAQEQPNAPLPEERPNTVILNEDEYNELLNRANNPECPTCPPPEIIYEEVERPKRNVASKKGLSLRLGGGVNYMYGADNSTNEEFTSDHISWYAEGMLGYVVNYDQKGLGTVMGAFVNVGNTNDNSIQKFLDDGLAGGTANNSSDNMYYQVELGAVLFETIRISSGSGYQTFRDAANNEQEVYYYSTTGGVHLGKRFVKLTLDLNFLYGRDLEQTVLRPMVGVTFQL